MLDTIDSYLCPVRALTDWVKLTGVESGYLFRTIDIVDRASSSLDKHMARIVYFVTSVD